MAYFTESEIEELREAFTVFDKDGSGSVTKDVLCHLARNSRQY